MPQVNGSVDQTGCAAIAHSPDHGSSDLVGWLGLD
jgi:hypothetical protein